MLTFFTEPTIFCFLFFTTRIINPSIGNCGSGDHWGARGGQAFFPSGPEPSSWGFSRTICPSKQSSQNQVRNSKQPLNHNCLRYKGLCVFVIWINVFYVVCNCIGTWRVVIFVYACTAISAWAGRSSNILPDAMPFKVVINLLARLFHRCSDGGQTGSLPWDLINKTISSLKTVW